MVDPNNDQPVIMWRAGDGGSFPVDRQSDGKLPAFTSLGGYPVIYLDVENNVLCAACADDPDNGARLADVHYEGDLEECTDCGTKIESAYGPIETES